MGRKALAHRMREHRTSLSEVQDNELAASPVPTKAALLLTMMPERSWWSNSWRTFRPWADHRLSTKNPQGEERHKETAPANRPRKHRASFSEVQYRESQRPSAPATDVPRRHTRELISPGDLVVQLTNTTTSQPPPTSQPSPLQEEKAAGVLGSSAPATDRPGRHNGRGDTLGS